MSGELKECLVNCSKGAREESVELDEKHKQWQWQRVRRGGERQRDLCREDTGKELR